MTVIAVILPVFLLIFLGFGLKRSGFLGEAFWEAAERLTYFLLLPALLLSTLAEAEFAGLGAGPMVLVIMAALLVMAMVLLALRPRLAPNGAAFTSVAQGSLRGNTYIGLAVAVGLFGARGLDAAAVAVAATVPLVNVLSVAALTRFAGAQPDFAGMLRAMARNPLILACAIGLLLNLSGLGLPGVIDEMLVLLGRGALPLGLLAVGAGLNVAAMRKTGRSLAAGLTLRLAALPLLTALGCWIVGLSGMAAAVAVLFNALPTATSSYILARHLGGDAQLMAGLITAQTGLAMLTLPLWLILLT